MTTMCLDEPAKDEVGDGPTTVTTVAGAPVAGHSRPVRKWLFNPPAFLLAGVVVALIGASSNPTELRPAESYPNWLESTAALAPYVVFALALLVVVARRFGWWNVIENIGNVTIGEAKRDERAQTRIASRAPEARLHQ